MNFFKLLSAVTLAAVSLSLGAMVNFDMVNSYPNIPVYYKINDEPNWQVLNKAHYRVSHHMAENEQIRVILSATPDDTHLTHFTFPLLQGRTARSSRGQMTCYVQVHVSCPSMNVLIAPQNEGPARLKTKFGLPLNNNISYPIIRLSRDEVVGTAPEANQTRAATSAAQDTSAPTVQDPTTNQTTTTVVNQSQTPAANTAQNTAQPATTTPAAQPNSPQTPVANSAPQPTIWQQIGQQIAQRANRIIENIMPPVSAESSNTQQVPAPAVPVIGVHTQANTSATASTSTQPQLQADPADPILAELGINQAQAMQVFVFFRMLNGLLAQAEQAKNMNGLRNLVAHLAHPDRRQFEVDIKRIRGLAETEVLPEDNTINIVWQHILNNRPEDDRQNNRIADYMATVLQDSHYMDGVNNLSALLQKWQTGFPQGGVVPTIWGQLNGLQKLYYLKLIQFRNAAVTIPVMLAINS